MCTVWYRTGVILLYKIMRKFRKPSLSLHVKSDRRLLTVVIKPNWSLKLYMPVKASANNAMEKREGRK